MTLYSLKTSTDQDTAFLCHLYAAVRQKEVESWGWSADQSVPFLQMQWSMQQQSYKMQFPQAVDSIIQHSGEPIGRLLLQSTDQAFRIIDVALMPEYQNQGIGTSIIKDIQLQASKQNSPVLLSVSVGNPAQHLYERLGFVIVEQSAMYTSMMWQLKFINLIEKEERKTM